MKKWTLLSLLIGAWALSACSSSSQFARMSYEDDLYYVSGGEIDADSRANNNTSPSSTYEEYMRGRSAQPNNDRFYDDEAAYTEENYDRRDYRRNLERYNDPLWHDPSFGMGLGGYWGLRSYMLFNPYYPPFWSMRPGWNFSFGYGFGGWGMGVGFGSPWVGGFYDPFFSPFYSPWYNPWYNPWYGGWGGGWRGGWGEWSNAGPAIPRQPVRSSRIGSSAPPRPRTVFSSPRETVNSPSAIRQAAPGRAVTPNSRQTSPVRMRPNPGEQRPSRISPTPSRSNPGPINENRGGSFNRPSSPSTPATPSRQPSYNPPSRGGGAAPSRPSGGGGGRPSGVGGSRPR
jgi:hypothetical protein